MSDYLSHLLERSFAPALKVRPQSPSLFEPPPSTHLVERPADLDQATHIETAAAPLPANDWSRNISTAGSAKPIAPHTEPIPPSTEDARTPPLGTLQAGEPTLRPIIPAQVAAVTTPTKMSAEKPTPLPPKIDNGFKPSGPASSPVPVRSVKMVPFETRAPAPSVAQPAPNRATEKQTPTTLSLPVDPRPSRAIKESTQDESSRPTPGIRPRSVAVATHLPAPAAGRESSVRVITNHPASVAGRMQHERGSGESAPTSPSTIQVTIGRVEVRATASPAPARAPARKESGMSLDAYLQRRATGGRP